MHNHLSNINVKSKPHLSWESVIHWSGRISFWQQKLIVLPKNVTTYCMFTGSDSKSNCSFVFFYFLSNSSSTELNEYITKYLGVITSSCHLTVLSYIMCARKLKKIHFSCVCLFGQHVPTLLHNIIAKIWLNTQRSFATSIVSCWCTLHANTSLDVR